MLLIDDDKELLLDLTLMIKDQEHCLQAQDSQQALRLFKKHPAEVCLIDIQLPPFLNEDQNLEGIYLAKEIMRESDHHTHIIFMSQYDFPKINNLPFPYHFLKKPFHVNQLLEIIAQFES